MPLLSGQVADPSEVAAPWQDWSSSWAWSSSGTQPALNNGSVTAKYSETSALVIAAFELIMGSGTTYGTGEWRFAVPVNAASPELWVGSAFLYDDSTAANRKSGIVRFLSATTLLVYAQAGEVAVTQPFTWAAADRLRLTIAYEPA